ncbi:acyl-CoA dehydrogenase family protein [Agrococcus baldri]|uniref:Isovaleryl-CoA dehydrogenase n=1 Tax=Agrococcus baldri TaxID=153730 RepID=A0AA87UQL8_9MICO|nr:acyl-CoA dehydrogenase family protein [Agrococcus baldri]GEK79126.1 isovaleryl-CoA dehydrogenase [Agrococcus baldri]
MQFELDEEQAEWRSILRRFVEKEVAPFAREYEEAHRYPTEIIEKMKDLGLFGVTVPDQYGGMDTGAVGLAIMFEEISRGWMSVAGALGSHTLACFMIAKHGTEEQKQRLLPDLATGKRRTALALTEAGAGSDLQGIKTRAVRDGDGYRINGSKMWITNARYADPLPVLVRTGTQNRGSRELSILLVDGDAEGLEVSRDLGKLGYRGIETCEVVLNDVWVPEANLLGGEEGKGLKQVLSSLEIGRVNVAARSLGIAQSALDKALTYAKQREAFEQPIAEFQAVQLKLAKMATDIQAARLLTWWAASAIDRGARSDVESGMAKYLASETAVSAALESMRIHGASGYSTEFEVERLYRDAPLMVIGEGTNDILSMVIARGLLKNAG